MDLARLSTDALASFAVFADHLNFTRAAEELHISQPALHVKVRKLTETLGRPLYTRHGRRLVLTPAGEQVARFARDLDARVTAFLASVHGTEPGRVPTLAAGEGAYLYLLGDAVHPGIRLINGDRARTLTAVRTGRADVGVAVLDVLPSDIEAVPLATYPQVLVMPDDHPLTARAHLTLADLADAALIVPPPSGPHRVTLERALRAAEVPWSIAVEAEGWPLMLHFASLRVGLAVVNGCVRPSRPRRTRDHRPARRPLLRSPPARPRRRSPGRRPADRHPHRAEEHSVHFEISVDIDAAPDTVWRILTDVERWPDMTDSVDRVEILDKPFALSSRARVHQPKLPAAIWTVTDFTENENFTWESRSPASARPPATPSSAPPPERPRSA